MSQKTVNFLLKLGEDMLLAEKYKADPKGTMDAHDVPEEHQKMIMNGDKEGLKKSAGVDDTVANFLIV